MKCVDKGILQAYLDGELDLTLKKQLDGHLAGCNTCRQNLDEIRVADDFSFEKLSHYMKFNESLVVPVADSIMIKENEQVENKTQISKGGLNRMIKKYGKFAAMICLAVLVTAVLTIAPVRAFIANALNIFRVENVKGINITFEDLESIKKQLENKNGSVNIDNFIQIQQSGFEENKIELDEARKIDGLTVLLPDINSGSLSITKINRGTINFTVNVEQVNQMLKSFEAKKLLPESVDGKTFTAVFESQIAMEYSIDGNEYHVLELKAPSLEVPSDVNEDEIYQCLVEFPLIPDDVKQQLKTIKDWRSTVYVPVLESNTEKVDINGSEGFITKNDDGSDSSLVWYNKGTIYTLVSNAGINKTIEFAKNLR